MQSKDVKAYGADYSAREFTPAEIGQYPGVKIDFLIRYIGYPTNRKCISYYPGAYKAHVNAGRPVGLYHQIGYGDMEGGEDAGRAHGQIALADARSSRVGWDGESPIIACLDRFKAKQGYRTLTTSDLRAYMKGFRGVVGSATGWYSFYDAMQAAIDEKWANFYIQCGARSAHIPGIDAWQENNEQPRLLGTPTDRLELYKPLNEVFGTGDEMSWETPITLTADERRQYEPGWTGGNTTFSADVWAKYSSYYAGLNLEASNQIRRMLTESAARETATLAALATISKNPLVTEDKLRELINAAVKDHVKITGTIEIGSVLPPVSEA